MGKQAKPKPANQKGEQRKHNPLTKWSNDIRRRPDLLWDWGLIYDAVEEDLPNDEHRTFLVRKSPESQRAFPEPYDDILLDWELEIQHYAIENKAKIEREHLQNGGTRYTVYVEYQGVGTKIIRKNLLVIETPRGSVSFSPKKHRNQKKFVKKNKGKKEEVAAPIPSS
jgi:hypothetical protein